MKTACSIIVMTIHCDDYANKSNVENYLKELLPKKSSKNDFVKYKQ